MRLGIFLGYGPFTRFTTEGLGRYLGGLLKGFTELDNKPLILAPLWSKDSLNDLIHELNIKEENIEIIYTKNIPIVWRIYKHLLNKKSNFQLKTYLEKYIVKA